MFKVIAEMSWSSVKRLANEMVALENESNRFVSNEKYYVVRVSLDAGNFEDMKMLADVMLCSTPQPISVYFNLSEIALVFSCVSEGEQHHLRGDHHGIVSFYAREFAREVPSSKTVDVKLVEFATQTQVTTYLGWVVFQASQLTMQRMSKGVITDKLLHFRTEKELIELLAKESVVWDAVPAFERYGTFLRLRRKRDKVVTVELSEPFDARESKRYTSFVFA